MLLVLLCKKCKAINPETLGRLFLVSFLLVFSLFHASSTVISGPLLWLAAFTLSVNIHWEAAGALKRNDEILTSIVVNVRDWNSIFSSSEGPGNEKGSISTPRSC